MKKLLSLILALAFVASLLPTEAVAWADPQSGTCGTNLTWTLAKGVLTVSGTGDMTNYSASSNYSSGKYKYSTNIPWFNTRSEIKSIVIEDGVTSIGKYAFYNCTSVRSVTIGNDVASIGDYAFFDCIKLTSITIGDSVTTIGGYAFCYCTSLTSVVIGDGVTSIGESTFYGCKSLTSITIGDSVTTIGGYAFCYCTSLTSVVIGDGVTSIGNGAFEYCTSLTSITIGDSVTTIGGYAFYYCKSLTSIVIPDGVTTIGDWAFYECTSLTSITIPDSVTSIGNCAFEYCSSLTSVVIPDSVTSIGDSAFFYCKSLTSITIPDGVTTIGYGAFEYCTSLTSIVIPDSVTSIGDFAFYSTRLKDIYYYGTAAMWDQIRFIRNHSNSYYNSYYGGDPHRFILNATRHYIGTSDIYTYEFTSGNAYITEADAAAGGDIAIPETLGGYAVTTIGKKAFYNNAAITSVTIPASVTVIEKYAFSGCDGLTDVYYGGTEDDWANIEIGTANNRLVKAKMHYADASDGTFTYDVSNGNATITGAAAELSGEIVIPATIGGYTVVAIADRAFYENAAITAVTIPEGVTCIGKYAFYNNAALETVNIPESVTEIGKYAFSYCNAIAAVNYAGDAADWASITIGTANNRLVKAPINYAK